MGDESEQAAQLQVGAVTVHLAEQVLEVLTGDLGKRHAVFTRRSGDAYQPLQFVGEAIDSLKHLFAGIPGAEDSSLFGQCQILIALLQPFLALLQKVADVADAAPVGAVQTFVVVLLQTVTGADQKVDAGCTAVLTIEVRGKFYIVSLHCLFAQAGFITGKNSKDRAQTCQ